MIRADRLITLDLIHMAETSVAYPYCSFENSLSRNFLAKMRSVQNTKVNKSPPKPGPTKDYFNEVTGCFQSGSVESDDSFEVVFHDSPRSRQSSECSDDFDIVFEDSPDTCYTSNDVFGEADDSTDSEDSDSDSDSDMSDTDCSNLNLSGSLSKSVSNLADDNLYVDHSEDEVDCANIEDLKICDSVEDSEIDDTVNFSDSKGVLLDERKKMLRKKLPAKRVRFSPNPPKVHVMCVWLFAAKQTRCRYWQQFAVDRERFKRRIADVDMAVSWVLKPQHRSRIMFQRFMPWWNAQKRKEIADKKERVAQEQLKEDDRLRNEKIEIESANSKETDKKIIEENTDTSVSLTQEEEKYLGDGKLESNVSRERVIVGKERDNRNLIIEEVHLKDIKSV